MNSFERDRNQDKPTWAYNTVAVGRWGARDALYPQTIQWEWIDAAQKRMEDLPEVIAYKMRVIRGRFNAIWDLIGGKESVIDHINKVKRLIWESIASQLKFSTILSEIREIEKKIASI